MHTQLVQYKKLMTVIMLFCFLFSQVALAAPQQPAAPFTDPNALPTTGGQTPQFTNNSNQAVFGTADQLSNYYFNQFKNSWGWDWLKTTNINFTAFSGGTPQWNINTFQPLTMKENLNNFLFAQGQYGTNTNTVNVGLGYRSMDANHSSMFGVNLFYDWQTTVQGEAGYNPTGSHMRIGAGLEYFTGSIETRLNGYYGVSSDVQVGGLQTTGVETGTTAWQHVAPGADLSVGTDFSFWNAPWLKLTATGSYYQQTQGGTINGFQGSPMYGNLTAQLQVTPQLSINGGGTVGNGGQSSANVGVQFNLLAPPTPALFMADPVVNTLAASDISYKILQPVQRNNAITVERYTKQTAPSTVAVTIGIEQALYLPALTVKANDASSGSTIATGIWNAVNENISLNLAPGTYNFVFNYFGTDYQPTGGQNINISAAANLDLGLAEADYALLGNLTFTAVDGQGSPIGIPGIPFSFTVTQPPQAQMPTAAVSATTAAQTYTTGTAQDGTVTIAGAPIGTYSGTYTLNAQQKTTSAVDLAAGQSSTCPTGFTPQELNLLNLSNWEFVFVDQNGSSVDGSLSIIQPNGNWRINRSGNHIKVSFGPGAVGLGYGTVTGPNGETTHFDLEPQDGSTSPYFKLKTITLQSKTGPTQLVATVTNLAGTPITNGDVYAASGSSGDPTSMVKGTNNNDGTYSFVGLPSGQYHFAVLSNSIIGLYPEVITIQSGQPVQNIAIAYDNSTNGLVPMKITYQNESGVPISNIFLGGQNDVEHAKATYGVTDSTGSVTLYLTAGLGCHIAADVFQQSGPMTMYEGTVPAGGGSVTIKQTQPTGNVKIHIQNYQAAAGQYTVWTSVKDGTFRYYSAYINANGDSFIQIDQSGQYNFTVVSPDLHSILAFSPIQGISATGSNTVNIQPHMPLGTVSLAITDTTTGQPITNWHVTIYDANTGVHVDNTGGQAGQGALFTLPTGNYRMVVDAPGYVTSVPKMVLVSAGPGQTIPFAMAHN